MTKHAWRIYWGLILLSQIIFELAYLRDYQQQPNLNSLTTGRALYEGIISILLAFFVFSLANIYALVICIKKNTLFKWLKAFIGSIILIAALSWMLSIFSERYMPLNAWEQTSAKTLARSQNALEAPAGGLPGRPPP